MERYAKISNRNHGSARMDGPIRSLRAGSSILAWGLAVALAAPLTLLAANAAPQKNKNKENDLETAGIVSPVPLPDQQLIETAVSEMLGAWQIGEVDRLHKYYADDVMVVSAANEAPLIGWDAYSKAYKAQFARTQGTTLDRMNSYIKVAGNSAWVTYQWRYAAAVDGALATAFGHTTLVLEKRNGAWLIVLNHTSIAATGAEQSTQQSASPPAGQPAALGSVGARK